MTSTEMSPQAMVACRWHKQYNHISSTEGEVIWLIRAENREKHPARRQYITVLTAGTIKLLCHLLFLPWEQGIFIPPRLNIQLCVCIRGRIKKTKATNSSHWSNYWPTIIDHIVQLVHFKENFLPSLGCTYFSLCTHCCCFHTTCLILIHSEPNLK